MALISEAQETVEIHKLLPETHSPGVDYSLFIMETVEKSLEKVETTPPAPRRSFPPPICSSRSLFRGFCVSAALSSERVRESIFILVFRSRRSHGDEDRWHRRLEAPDGLLHAARESGRVGPPILALGLTLLHFLRS